MVAGLVGGPPLYYLHYHGYPLAGPEVLAPAVVGLLGAVLIGGVINRASRPTRIVAFALLLTVFADLQFSAAVDLSFKLVPVVMLAVVWLLEPHFEKIAGPALAVFYLASLPMHSSTRPSHVDFTAVHGDTLLPPVLYVILDEHIGDAGWPAEFASTRNMQRRVRQFYLDRDFRLFGAAYSEYGYTRFSIPATLNWTVADPRRADSVLVPGRRYRLTTDELFGRLSSEGYRIRVYQSSYLDFCDARAYRIRSCDTYPANGVRGISLLGIPWWEKLVLVATFYLEHDSHLYGRGREFYSRLTSGRRLPPWPEYRAWFSFPSAMRAADRLRADLQADDPRGTLYFAHLLAPHHSLLVNGACRFWGLNALAGMSMSDEAARAPAVRAQQYDRYSAQVGCLYEHLRGLFSVIDSGPARREFVVIVHGDHGSRIALHDLTAPNLLRLQRSDVEDGLSTLFAVRAPAIAPGYDARRLALGSLVRRLVETRFCAVDLAKPRHPTVNLWAGPGLPFDQVPLADSGLALAGLPGAQAPSENPGPGGWPRAPGGRRLHPRGARSGSNGEVMVHAALPGGVPDLHHERPERHRPSGAEGQ